VARSKARSKLRLAAASLTKGAKGLTDIARQIRALDALYDSLDCEQLSVALNKVTGDLRAFRATTLQEVIEAVAAETPVDVVEDSVE